MSTAFHELLPGFHGNKTGGEKDPAEKTHADPKQHESSQGDRTQIWIIGSREQVVHTMNEFYVKKIANDRVKFTPIVPAPFQNGKYMTVLVR